MADERVVIVDYDPEWPFLFAAERERLRAAMGEGTERIDHVGSTSVPGLAAKPIVDIQISVASFEPPETYDEPLRGLGYGPRPDLEPAHRFYRYLVDGTARFHVHICETGKDWESDHLLFREFLKANPRVAEKYAEMKREKALRFPESRERYTDAKAPHIEGIMAAARRWFESSVVHRS
jgi:GrpB-like predicted nucleotidyltransferase (UPF0157 family)